MPDTTLERRLDLLVAEVGAVRRQLDAVSTTLGVPIASRPPTDSPVAEPHSRHDIEAGLHAPSATPSATPPAEQIADRAAGSRAEARDVWSPPRRGRWGIGTADAAPADRARTADGGRAADRARVTDTARTADRSRATDGARVTDRAPTAAHPVPAAPSRATAGLRATPHPSGGTSPAAGLFTPARLLAAGGAIVTILGVGFLLAVAIAAGLFGPVPRVVTLAVLAGGLGVAAGRLRDTSPEAGIALAATSCAAAFGVVVAATSVYDWVPPTVGIVAALAIAALGVLVAHRWRSQVLAGLLQVEVFVVLPIVLSPLDTAAIVQLVLFTALAYAPAVWLVRRHGWWPLFHVSSALVLFVAAAALVGVQGGGLGWVLLGMAWLLVLLVGGLACAFDAVVVTAVGLGVSALAGVMLHTRAVREGLDPLDSVALLALAAVIGVVAWRVRGRLREVLVLGATLHLLLATGCLPVAHETIVVLVAAEALLLHHAARARRDVVLTRVATGLTALAFLGSLVVVAPPVILSTRFAVADGTWQGVVLGVILAGIAAEHLQSPNRLPMPGVDAPARARVAAALALYGVSATLVSLGTLPGLPHVLGMAADVTTTLTWVAAAVAMMLRPAAGLTRVGYVVLVLAVGKLFLVDLHAVDGILRAVLFVLTGLALIAASSGIRRNMDRGTDDVADPPHAAAASSSPSAPPASPASSASPALPASPWSPASPASPWSPASPASPASSSTAAGPAAQDGDRSAQEDPPRT